MPSTPTDWAAIHLAIITEHGNGIDNSIKCPLHDDRRASAAVRINADKDGIMTVCYAGCDAKELWAALVKPRLPALQRKPAGPTDDCPRCGNPKPARYSTCWDCRPVEITTAGLSDAMAGLCPVCGGNGLHMAPAHKHAGAYPLLSCHACHASYDALWKALAAYTASHNYRWVCGALYQMPGGSLRPHYRAEPGKVFWWDKSDGAKSAAGRLPCQWSYPDAPDAPCIITEGEKAAAALASHPDIAAAYRIYSAGEAGALPNSNWDNALAGASCIILWADNDNPGRQSAQSLAWQTSQNTNLTDDIRIVQPEDVVPDWPDKADAADCPPPQLPDVLNTAAFYVPDPSHQPPVASDPRPAFTAGAADYNDISNHAQQVVLDTNWDTERNPLLYSHDQSIVRIISANDGTGAQMQTLPIPLLRKRMAEVIRWYHTAKNGDELPSYPPQSITLALDAGLPTVLPYLTGIRYAPLMTAPATPMTQHTGYSADSRCWHVIPNAYDEALAALDTTAAIRHLRLLTCDFPFVDEADFAGWVALLITYLTRPAYDLAPLFMMTKPASRTGATLLAKVAACILTGNTEPTYAQLGTDEDEARKALASAALLPAGRGLIMLDNLDTKLNSATLAEWQTTETWMTRRLGSNSSHIILPPRAFVTMATGNNVVSSLDILGRTCPIRLDAKHPSPGERSGFRFPNLLAHARSNRVYYLACLGRLITDWQDAGAPTVPTPSVLGGFESWMTCTGSILAHAGIPGFLANTKDYRADAADEDDSSEADFVCNWWHQHRTNEVNGSQLLQIAGINDQDTEPTLTVAGSTPQQQQANLGFVMRRLANKSYELPDGTHVTIKALGRAKGSGRRRQWQLRPIT